jgi:hypothetical protein
MKRKRLAKMKFSRRLILSILFISLSLLVGIFFWPLILNEIIKPISMAVWLFLRIFVLSIGQKYYWSAIIFLVFILIFRHLTKEEIPISSWDSKDSNDTLKTIQYWGSLFTMIDHEIRNEKALKRELARLVVSLYATKQRTSANFGLYDALQRGEIPLPEHIHTVLFLEEQKESRRSLRKLIQTVRKTPRKWICRWTGQETADNYQMINEVLSFIETSLEIKNDDGKFTPN